MDQEEPMDWEPAPPIFTEEEYQEWLAYSAKANVKCCKEPDIQSVLYQDRAMGEPHLFC